MEDKEKRTHLSHCFQGECEGVCKYLDEENCPAKPKEERIIPIELKLKDLEVKMYNLNANLSALIYIQKLKSKEEAEGFLKKINQEIGSWIKEVRKVNERGTGK